RNDRQPAAVREHEPVLHLTTAGLERPGRTWQLVRQRVGALGDELQRVALEAGFLENLPAHGAGRLFALLEAALRELPRASDVATLAREHVAVLVDDHGSDAGAEKSAGVHAGRFSTARLYVRKRRAGIRRAGGPARSAVPRRSSRTRAASTSAAARRT